MLDSISIPGPLTVGKNENALRTVSWNHPRGLDPSLNLGTLILTAWLGCRGAGNQCLRPQQHPCARSSYKTWQSLNKDKEMVCATVPLKALKQYVAK